MFSGTCRSYPGKRLKFAEKGDEQVSIVIPRSFEKRGYFYQNRLHTCIFYRGKTCKYAVTVFIQFDALKKQIAGVAGSRRTTPGQLLIREIPTGGNLRRKLNDRNYTT